jgi:hypothetical protein
VTNKYHINLRKEHLAEKEGRIVLLWQFQTAGFRKPTTLAFNRSGHGKLIVATGKWQRREGNHQKMSLALSLK